MEKQIPEFLKTMLIEQYGEEIANKIIDGYSKQRYVTLRANTIKATNEEIKKELDHAFTAHFIAVEIVADRNRIVHVFQPQ